MSLKRAAAYVRVSSEEQGEGWSLEGQEQAIREYAERNSYEIMSVYQDEDSGSKDKRPGLEQMLMDAHAGRFQAILVYHTSRLFRNIALARRYKDLLRNKLNIEVLFINQPVADPGDPMAFMMETFNELFDEYYLHQLRFWTGLGKKTRAQNGMWNGTLPFGYTTDEETGKPVPHPENARGLQMAFEAYATGQYSDRQAADLLNREGYKTTGNWGERPFTKDTVNRILKNEFYLGFTKYKGELFPGEHPPLVEKALFDKCQEVRAGRRNKSRAIGKTKRVYIFSGIARCHDCGLTLRCAGARSIRYYRHMADERGYECSAPPKAVRADNIEPQWAEIIGRIQLPEDWRRRVEELAGNEDERAAIIREREQVEEKLRRLKRMYRDLIIDDEEYKTSVEELRRKLDTLVLPDNPQVVSAGEYLENLGMLWEAATLKEQRDITRMLLEATYVNVVEQRIVAIEPKPAFRLLLAEVCTDVGVELV